MFVIVLIEISDDPVMSIKEAGNMHLADKYMEKQ